MADAGKVSVREAIDQDQPTRPTASRRTWLALAVGGAVLAAAALVVGGAYLGWRAAAPSPQPVPSASLVTVAADPYDGAQVAVEMPDVRGLARTEALTVLSDAGIPSRVVTTEDVPWAGVAGLVVGQSPLFGTANPTQVTLRVAVPVTVPEVVGMSEEEALAGLEGIGARVEVSRVYRPGKTPGTVVSVTPLPGQPVPDAVSLITAAEPDAIFLDQVDTLDGYCGSAPVTVNGIDYEHSVTCSAGSTERPNVVAYSLRRGVQTVTGTVGIDDESDPTATATVTVVVDGKTLQRLTVAYGKPAKLSLTTAGRLRLEFRVTSPESVRAVLADLQLVGDPAAIAVLGDTT